MCNISKSMENVAPKKGGSSEMGNHTPLSLLSIPSKVYEGIKGESIDKYVIDRGLVSKISMGFCENRIN